MKTNRSSVITEGALPLSPKHRTWGALALYGNSGSAAVATWCFITGGLISLYLPAGQGSLAITAGTLLGIFLMYLAVVPATTKYGIEAVRSTRPQLGARGSYFSLFLLVAILIGWNAVLIIFLGRAGTSALVAMGVLSAENSSVFVAVIGLAGCVVVWLLLRGGPEALRNIGPVIAISVIVLSVAIMVVLITTVGLSAIFSTPPHDPEPEPLLNYAIILEYGVAGGIAWWAYVGGLTRFSKSTKGAVLPVVSGLGLTMSVVLIVGLFAGLAVPESGGDPTMFLIEIGGPAFGAIALGFIVFANIGTAVVGLYSCALALKQIPAVDRRIGWNGATALGLLPVVVILLFFATPFMDNYGAFLATAGLMISPICGVQIADYYFLRKQHLDIRALYSDSPGNKYWYTRGFNMVGFISIAVGIIAYLSLYNPYTYTPGPGFEYLTASVPAAIASAIAYLIGTKIQRRISRNRDSVATYEATLVTQKG